MKNILLIAEDNRVPTCVRQAVDELGYSLSVETDPRSLFQFTDIRRIDLLMIWLRPDDQTAWSLLELVADTISATHLPLVVIGDDLDTQHRVRALQMGAIDCFTVDIPMEELRARLAKLAGTKARFDTIIDQNVKTILLARKLRQSADKLDEELRLARRLQMDFLPRQMPRVGKVRFAARLYPAGWVSGDFYDVFRLDERHVGFYIADAIGHGVPAALLTIFVKHGLRTKRINGQSYDLVPPNEALASLNTDLIAADLHESPFISMLYCIVDVQTGEMTYARAGHPRPLLLCGQKPPEELPGDGPLLGVMPNGRFELATRRLVPGERLLLYTDGAERCQSEAGGRKGIEAFFDEASARNAAGLDTYLQSLLDVVLKPRDKEPIYDDVTLVAMDMTDG